MCEIIKMLFSYVYRQWLLKLQNETIKKNLWRTRSMAAAYLSTIDIYPRGHIILRHMENDPACIIIYNQSKKFQLNKQVNNHWIYLNEVFYK